MSIPVKETAFKWIEDHKKRVIEVSDTIWEYAELGLIEYKSATLAGRHPPWSSAQLRGLLAAQVTAG
ncbi:MAG: hypothetical protein NWE89_07305 [Candidatus Bathyarchaeota archaeon]|nr:hypothetical protein [Candidatus Bathyarchaeota archaeon]